jgi:hypothetical protein
MAVEAVSDTAVSEGTVTDTAVTDADVTAGSNGCGDKRKRKDSQHHSAHEHDIELVMAESLNACGWTKVSIYMLVLSDTTVGTNTQRLLLWRYCCG